MMLIRLPPERTEVVRQSQTSDQATLLLCRIFPKQTIANGALKWKMGPSERHLRQAIQAPRTAAYRCAITKTRLSVPGPI